MYILIWQCDCQLTGSYLKRVKQKGNKPDAVEEVAVVVSIDIEFISYAVVQHRVAVLEVVEDTQDRTVVVVR